MSDFDGSAMPSHLVGISKVAAYCLQLGTEMHSDRSNYILHIEVLHCFPNKIVVYIISNSSKNRSHRNKQLSLLNHS